MPHILLNTHIKRVLKHSPSRPLTLVFMSTSDSESNAETNDNDLPPIILPSGNPSPALLIETLRKAPRQIQELRDRNIKLRHDNAVLQGKVKRRDGGSRRGNSKADSTFPDHHERIVVLGKQWAIMHDPWINDDAFMRLLSTDALDPFSAARFATQKAYEKGYISELHQYLAESAPHLKDLAEKIPKFGDEFTKQMGNERSVALDVIRKNAAALIFPDIDVPALLWTAPAGEERSHSAVFKSLLYMPNKSLHDNPFSPIFFPQQNVQSRDIFMNEYQPRMLRIALFGPNSLQTPPDKFRYGSSLLGMKWGVTEVNASSIVWSALMLRFLLTPDTQFSEQGLVSGIDYRECFYEYRQMIVNHQLDPGSTYATRLFSFFNQRVFPGLPSATGPGSDGFDLENSQERTNAMSEMMERLRMTSPSPDLVLSAPVMVASTVDQPIEVDDGLGSDLNNANSITNDTAVPAQQINRGRGGRGRGRGRGTRGARKPDATVQTRSTRSRKTD
ncbi:hypothetical protein VKT23_017055 [Stygiomarasmius scandens]|uniref:Uncharacterized protein n=1 Tax=Marasmiellus scandens TaxID=2682957 RepID=A0ABR1IUN4_9AGAR